MEDLKCSCKKHEENKAIFYCPECKIYMCNKCDNHHSELFQSHHQYKLDKDSKLIFTGFCKEVNHLDRLEYFCKSHKLRFLYYKNKEKWKRSTYRLRCLCLK